MQLQNPFAVVTSGVDGDVLSVLASSRGEFTAPRLAQMIPARSLPGIRASLLRLVAQGVVAVHAVGRAQAFTLNDDHLAAPALRALADLKTTLLERLGAHVSTWDDPPVFGAVFGSAARGAMRVDSDIDVLLVHADDADPDGWASDVAELTRVATAWTGNDVRIVDLSVTEAPDRTTESLLRTIAAEGLPFTSDADWLRRALTRRAAG